MAVSMVIAGLIIRYANLISSLLKPQGRILMSAYVYNQSERNSKDAWLNTVENYY